MAKLIADEAVEVFAIPIELTVNVVPSVSTSVSVLSTFTKSPAVMPAFAAAVRTPET